LADGADGLVCRFRGWCYFFCRCAIAVIIVEFSMGLYAVYYNVVVEIATAVFVVQATAV